MENVKIFHLFFMMCKQKNSLKGRLVVWATNVFSYDFFQQKRDGESFEIAFKKPKKASRKYKNGVFHDVPNKFFGSKGLFEASKSHLLTIQSYALGGQELCF